MIDSRSCYHSKVPVGQFSDFHWPPRQSIRFKHTRPYMLLGGPRKPPIKNTCVIADIYCHKIILAPIHRKVDMHFSFLSLGLHLFFCTFDSKKSGSFTCVLFAQSFFRRRNVTMNDQRITPFQLLQGECGGGSVSFCENIGSPKCIDKDGVTRCQKCNCRGPMIDPITFTFASAGRVLGTINQVLK